LVNKYPFLFLSSRVQIFLGLLITTCLLFIFPIQKIHVLLIKKGSKRSDLPVLNKSNTLPKQHSLAESKQLNYQNSLNSVNSNDSLNEKNNSPFLVQSPSATVINNSKNNLFNANSTNASLLNQASKKSSQENDPFDSDSYDDDIKNKSVQNNSKQKLSQSNSQFSGQISTGVGTMLRKSDDSPPLSFKNAGRNEPMVTSSFTAPGPAQTPFDSYYEKQRNASFIDIGPELFESTNALRNSQSSLRQDLVANSAAIAEKERKLLEMESRVKELEQQKRNFEVAFNNSDRLLAEKEKLISTMNAEKFKSELAFKNDMSELLREIAVLKENKSGLESKLQMSEQHSSHINLVQSENANNQAESYLIKIRALESHVDDLTNDRKILSQLKQELTTKIEEYEKAIEIVTEQADKEKSKLLDQLENSKRELGELNESKRRLQNEVDELRYQLNEKNLTYERINVEKV
jgi:hypothetical protein